MNDLQKLSDHEINKAIHEKVMGECWHEWESNSTGDRYACLKRKCFGISLYGTPDEPDYCSTIASAWVVVEKMEQNEMQFRILTKGCASGLANVLVYKIAGNVMFPEVADESLPRAICLAALESIGGL